jgi:hypothetical protein
MPHSSRGRGYFALVEHRRDLARRFSDKFNKYRPQLLGALDRVVMGLRAIRSKAA